MLGYKKLKKAPIPKRHGKLSSSLLKTKELVTSDNKGLTLVELLVAMLISAIVIGMVAMFVSIGSKNYSHASREIKLQMQAQTLTNQLDDIVIEAYWVGEKVLSTNVTAYVVYSNSIINVIFFNRYNNMIYIKDYYSISDIASITESSYTKEENLMAAYVTEFILAPNQVDNEVLITIKLKNKNANYSTVHTVALRNTMRTP